ncbi:hypothetical protein KEJ50_06480 [Candidatus Bathyarchaeota archaeon]|nr:hypothetical protein [Candidatus Bathyarchaeota archaeon]
MSDLERKHLYKKRETHLLLSYMINGHEDLKPKLQNGIYTFQEVNEILGNEANLILEELAEKEILKPYLVDMEVTCPKCASKKLKVKYLCPFCNSFKLTKGTLIEHYGCGAVDYLEKFLKDNEYICPKCNKNLKLIGVDYRKLDNIYRCEECKKIFSLPDILHICLDCESSFNYEGVKLTQVYGYRLNENFRDEIIANCVVEVQLTELLKGYGWLVEHPGILTGSSEVNHAFDIIARKNKETIAITVASDVKEVEAEVIISHFAKVYDSKPTKSVVIASPKLSNEAGKLANLYMIKIIEGETVEEIKGKFKDFIKQMEPSYKHIIKEDEIKNSNKKHEFTTINKSRG